MYLYVWFWDFEKGVEIFGLGVVCDWVEGIYIGVCFGNGGLGWVGFIEWLLLWGNFFWEGERYKWILCYVWVVVRRVDMFY